MMKLWTDEKCLTCENLMRSEWRNGIADDDIQLCHACYGEL